MPYLWRKLTQASAPNPMQLILTQTHLHELISYIKKDPLLESCGYLLGFSSKEDHYLTHIFPMKNIHKEPKDHFAFSPHDQLKAFQFLKTQSLQIIGVFHSHPQSPPILSEEDLKYIFSPHQSNLVVSLQNGTHFASYRLALDQIKEERIKIL